MPRPLVLASRAARRPEATQPATPAIDWSKAAAWTFEPCRYLDRAWHASPFADDGMREYLTFASPAEFRSRNIFTEERPLRRARSGLTRP